MDTQLNEKSLELYYLRKSRKYKKKIKLLEKYGMVGGSTTLSTPFVPSLTFLGYYNLLKDNNHCRTLNGTARSNVFIHSPIPRVTGSEHGYHHLTRRLPNQRTVIFVSGRVYSVFLKMVYQLSLIQKTGIPASEKLGEPHVSLFNNFKQAVLDESEMERELLSYNESNADGEPLPGYYYVHLLKNSNSTVKKQFLSDILTINPTADAEGFKTLKNFFIQYFTEEELLIDPPIGFYQAGKTFYRPFPYHKAEEKNVFRSFRQFKAITTQQVFVRVRNFHNSILGLSKESRRKNKINVDFFGQLKEYYKKNLNQNDQTAQSSADRVASYLKETLSTLITRNTQKKLDPKYPIWLENKEKSDLYLKLDLCGDDARTAQMKMIKLLRDSSKQGDVIWGPDAQQAVPNKTITTPLLYDLYQTEPRLFKGSEFYISDDLKTVDTSIFKIFEKEYLQKMIQMNDKDKTQLLADSSISPNYPHMVTYNYPSEKGTTPFSNLVEQYLSKIQTQNPKNTMLDENKDDPRWREIFGTNVVDGNFFPVNMSQQFYRNKCPDETILVYQLPQLQSEKSSYTVIKSFRDGSDIRENIKRVELKKYLEDIQSGKSSDDTPELLLKLLRNVNNLFELNQQTKLELVDGLLQQRVTNG